MTPDGNFRRRSSADFVVYRHALFLAGSLGMCGVSWGDQLVVRPDGSGAYPTIQSAVDASTDGDEILLTDGVFVGAGNRGVLVVSKSVTIRSESGDPLHCVVDCEGQTFGFEFWNAGPTLEGITITRAGNYEFGGAVVCVLATPLIRHCILRDNVAEQAAGIFGQWSSLVIENCLIVRNATTLTGGGGLICGLDSDATISRTTIANNRIAPGASGAGVHCTARSRVTMKNCIVAGNLEGEAVTCDATSSVFLQCSDVGGNPSGDWVGCLAGQEGVHGNFSGDPLFCDPATNDFTLREDSPCAPPGITGCGLVGARPVGCETVGIDAATWGELKAMYR